MTAIAEQEPSGDLRTRKKHATMQRAQAVALDLIEERGFDAVSIEELAAAAEVSPASMYRYFETKEGIVFWDPYDELLAANLAGAAGGGVDAIRDAIIAGLGQIYDEPRGDILRRTRLIYREPSLRQAVPARMLALGQWVASLLGGEEPTLADVVTARASVAALEVAIEHWQAENGRRSMETVITEAFEVLADNRS